MTPDTRGVMAADGKGVSTTTRPRCSIGVVHVDLAPFVLAAGMPADAWFPLGDADGAHGEVRLQLQFLPDAWTKGGGKAKRTGKSENKGGGKKVVSKGSGGVKEGGKRGDKVKHSSPDSSDSSTRHSQLEIIVGNEDYASTVRSIKKTIAAHRDGEDGDDIARALMAPVMGISGERQQLRFLRHAESVATKTLFKRKVADVGATDDEHENQSDRSRSSEVSSLLSSESSGTIEGRNMEAVLSMLAMQTTMIAVSLFHSFLSSLYKYVYIDNRA